MASHRITVADLFRLPVMKDCYFLAGVEGSQKRHISRVSVMDAPDAANWMHGEELILTSGYAMRDNPMGLKELLVELNEKKASGMGIKLGRFIDSLPEEVIAAADELEFPLFCIPAGYAFSDIITPVMGMILYRQSDSLDKQTSRLLYQDHVSRSFLELMISGGGLNVILQHLKTLINLDVVFFDYQTQSFLATDENSQFHARIASTPRRDSQELFHSISIDLAKEHYGRILIDHPRDMNLPENLGWSLDYAKIAILLHIQKENAAKEAKLRYKDNFLQGLLLRHIHRKDDIDEYLFILGPSFLPPYVVIVVDIDNIGSYPKMTSISDSVENPLSLREGLWTSLNNFLNMYFGRVHYTTIGGKQVSLISLSPDAKEKSLILDKLLRQFKTNFSTEGGRTISMAVGSIVNEISQISTSYKQASSCLDFAKTTGSRDSLFFWDKLGLLRLLITTSNKGEVKYFVDQYLGKLNTLKPAVALEYLETLDALSRNGWNLKSSSAELHIHYNTLRYRLKQIAEVVPFDIDNPEVRLELLIALKLYLVNKEMHFF